MLSILVAIHVMNQSFTLSCKPNLYNLYNCLNDELIIAYSVIVYLFLQILIKQ
jgi:hypothetical protein